ncbi:hypothetical protein A6R68_02850 [Neotoma lepida]|uniref:Uncharacterized protein n=1 Tax=Neotoma lepida TaxID=56216 RepID=A0A1A6GTG2_NEOLE|nr:hypothetical protein A6R68_02850 [Neotoma lepida]
MACPWKFLFRAKSHQGDLKEEKDINNNVGKTPSAVSRTTQCVHPYTLNVPSMGSFAMVSFCT